MEISANFKAANRALLHLQITEWADPTQRPTRGLIPHTNPIATLRLIRSIWKTPTSDAIHCLLRTLNLIDPGQKYVQGQSTINSCTQCGTKQPLTILHQILHCPTVADIWNQLDTDITTALTHPSQDGPQISKYSNHVINRTNKLSMTHKTQRGLLVPDQHNQTQPLFLHKFLLNHLADLHIHHTTQTTAQTHAKTLQHLKQVARINATEARKYATQAKLSSKQATKTANFLRDIEWATITKDTSTLPLQHLTPYEQIQHSNRARLRFKRNSFIAILSKDLTLWIGQITRIHDTRLTLQLYEQDTSQKTFPTTLRHINYTSTIDITQAYIINPDLPTANESEPLEPATISIAQNTWLALKEAYAGALDIAPYYHNQRPHSGKPQASQPQEINGSGAVTSHRHPGGPVDVQPQGPTPATAAAATPQATFQPQPRTAHSSPLSPAPASSTAEAQTRQKLVPSAPQLQGAQARMQAKQQPEARQPHTEAKSKPTSLDPEMSGYSPDLSQTNYTGPPQRLHPSPSTCPDTQKERSKEAGSSEKLNTNHIASPQHHLPSNTHPSNLLPPTRRPNTTPRTPHTPRDIPSGPPPSRPIPPTLHANGTPRRVSARKRRRPERFTPHTSPPVISVMPTQRAPPLEQKRRRTNPDPESLRRFLGPTHPRTYTHKDILTRSPPPGHAHRPAPGIFASTFIPNTAAILTITGSLTTDTTDHPTPQHLYATGNCHAHTTTSHCTEGPMCIHTHPYIDTTASDQHDTLHHIRIGNTTTTTPNAAISTAGTTVTVYTTTFLTPGAELILAPYPTAALPQPTNTQHCTTPPTHYKPSNPKNNSKRTAPLTLEPMPSTTLTLGPSPGTTSKSKILTRHRDMESSAHQL